MADLASLDEDTLRAKLDEVTSYEERSAIRKILREKKKAQGGGSSGTRRGTVGYNRFAASSGRITPEPKKQLYVRVKDDAPAPSFLRKGSSSSDDRKPYSPTSKNFSSPPPRKSESTPPPFSPPPKSEPTPPPPKPETPPPQEETPPPREETPPPREETPPPKPRSPSPPPVEVFPKEDTPPPRSPTPEEQPQPEETLPNEEAPYSPPPSPVSQDDGSDGNKDGNEEPANVDTPEDTAEVSTEPTETVPAPSSRGKDQTDGQLPFKVQLRPTEKPAPTKPRKTEPQNELEGFKLRKTTSNTGEGKKTLGSSTHDFGVKLKSSTTDSINTSKTTPSSQRQRSYTQYGSTPSSRTSGTAGGGPKTLGDFQRLANKSSNTTSEEAKLIAYVNTALLLNPPLSTADAFYSVCGRPSVLCNLINKSVRGTVDVRALTKSPPPNANKMDKLEALEENMTLVVESARAIGCQINDDTEDKLVAGDHSTIRHLVFELVKARLVHTPGMDEADPSTFTVLAVMMDKLGIATEEQDGGEEGVATKEEEPLSWRDNDYAEKRKKREEEKKKEEVPAKSTWRETPSQPASIDTNKESLNAELTYEERAALRKAEREKRKREREALAGAK